MSYHIGQRIEALRDARGMTQTDLADRLGMSRQRLSRIEKGMSDITYVLLTDIARELGTSVKDITAANETSSPGLTAYFRKTTTDEDTLLSVRDIESVLKTIHAHKRLYERTQGVICDD